jgi:hypothetical protein
MIISRDLMSQLGIILDFHGQTMMWDISTIKMKEYEDLSDIDSPVNEFYWHEESYESQALNDALCYASARLKVVVWPPLTPKIAHISVDIFSITATKARQWRLRPVPIFSTHRFFPATRGVR